MGKRTGARYIITVIEYLTRWEEERAVKDCSATTTTWFIFDDIIVDTETRVNQYQVQFKKKINLYLNHSIISNEK
jgi:hypothetical protein